MDYDAVRAGLQQLIPFVNTVGVEVTEVAADHGSARLPDGERTGNHVGSQHAGALFTAGETASGAAFVGAFAERMGEIVPLAERAEIAYLKIATGAITATGRFSSDRDALFAELDNEGRIRFPVEVELTDEAGEVVATMTVHWYVRKREAAAA
jgi:acyl-coenzyme A thioesterase PaaI-like protein